MIGSTVQKHGMSVGMSNNTQTFFFFFFFLRMKRFLVGLVELHGSLRKLLEGPLK